MAFLGFIFRRFRRFKALVLRGIYRCRGRWQCRLCGGTVDWPRSVGAAVPVRIDGVGHVAIGERVMLGFLPAFCLASGEILLQARERGSCISIGTGTAISNNIGIIAMKSVVIGEGCLIGDLVSIVDCDFHGIQPATRHQSVGEIMPVIIGNNVWLGSRVTVLKGVTIGDNSVVAAGSVVTKPLPANIVAAGVPARIVRQICG